MRISRASVTGAIAELERRHGIRLLNRTTRRVSVTDEGHAYYANCSRILGEIAEAEDDLSGARLVPQGRLRVSVPQSFVNSKFFPALSCFAERYPQLEIDIVLTDRVVNLVEEGIDCAIRGSELPEDSELVARTLSTVRWVTCGSGGYLRKHGTPRSIGDFAALDCIRFVSPSTGRQRDWQFRIDGETKSFTPNGRLRLNSFDAVIEATVAGCGVSQVPDALAYRSILDGQLQPVMTEYAAQAPSLLLVYPGNRYLTAKVRAFKDFFADAFPPNGWWSEIERKAG